MENTEKVKKKITLARISTTLNILGFFSQLFSMALFYMVGIILYHNLMFFS